MRATTQGPLRATFALAISIISANVALAITSTTDPGPAGMPVLPNGNISGGMFPAIGELFVDPDGDGNGSLCSGTLISPMHFLTAAHCFNTTGDSGPFSTGGVIKFQVAAETGMPGSDPNDPSDDLAQPMKFVEYEYMRAKIHPDWTGTFAPDNGDLAIVKLKKKVTGITPLELYMVMDQMDQMQLETGKAGDTVGWGLTNDRSFGVKRDGDNVVDGISPMGKTLLSDFDNNMSDTGTGQGDSGGPFLINGQVAGVLSYGSPPAGVAGDVIDHYGFNIGHTRVSHYKDWINMMIMSPTISNFDGGDWDIDDELITPGSDTQMPKLTIEETANDLGYFDIEISIPKMEMGGSLMMSIDKKITNATGKHWDELTMQIGTGVGAAFNLSSDDDNLFFKNDMTMPPMEQLGQFINPPMTDEAIDPDEFTWGSDPLVPPFGPAGEFGGVAPGEMALFWFAVSVPDNIDGVLDGMASFTIRQWVTQAVPEPSSFVVAGIALVGLVALKRRAA